MMVFTLPYQAFLTMSESIKLNYVEFASLDIGRSKAFFENAFDWRFIDYGSEYTAFNNSGLEGGIFASQRVAQAENGAPLLVLYAKNISEVQRKVEDAGGAISKPLFDFPGGCRFHFIEPGGNELAVWSESAKQYYIPVKAQFSQAYNAKNKNALHVI